MVHIWMLEPLTEHSMAHIWKSSQEDASRASDLWDWKRENSYGFSSFPLWSFVLADIRNKCAIFLGKLFRCLQRIPSWKEERGS